ncbi:hypothetical protein AB0H37_14695 [Actinomadura sp. NPDC023710]|uniref:hypothetical protein n=1 Tax=Actinomadura sp. NPDC023710 TaxID=3158219 RepID=UPI0033E00577
MTRQAVPGPSDLLRGAGNMVGNALLRIRDGRLYRADFGTFEEYCRERWGFSDSRARQLIGAAQTVTTVTVAGLPAPANEGQARALTAVPEPERAEVWRETVERTNGQPTCIWSSSTQVRTCVTMNTTQVV